MEERAKVFPLPSRTAQKDDVAQPLALEFTNPPSPLLIEPIVRTALAEDLGRAGDITTDNIIPAGETAHAAPPLPLSIYAIRAEPALGLYQPESP